MPQRALVTGASGFLGSHLSARLTSSGYEVHGVSRFHQAAGPAIATWWVGDLGDAAFVDGLFRNIRPAIVYHMAGAVSARADRELVLPTFNTLLRNALNMLIAADRAPEHPRVVLLGSVTEPAPDAPSPVVGSPYAAAKWAASIYARLFHSLFDTRVVVCRPSYAYGPGQPENRLIPYVITSLLKGEAPTLTSGYLTTDFIFVDDVADGLLKVASRAGIDGAIVDLGSGRLCSVKDVVADLTRLTNSHVQPIFGALPDRPLETYRVADVEGAARLLEWRATVSLKEGLARTVAWYRARLQSAGSCPNGQPEQKGFYDAMAV